MRLAAVEFGSRGNFGADVNDYHPVFDPRPPRGALADPRRAGGADRTVTGGECQPRTAERGRAAKRRAVTARLSEPACLNLPVRTCLSEPGTLCRTPAANSTRRC
jgi:hypothetical protein